MPMQGLGFRTTPVVNLHSSVVILSSMNIYETERLLHEYLLFHYGSAEEVLPWAFGPRDALGFAVRSVTELLDTTARQIDEQILHDHFADAYGIFAGKGDKTAVLLFNEYRARWVSEERWHPKQQGKFMTDGSYELRIPYGKPLELTMDILKYGPDVEVVAPEPLRQAVREKLLQAAALYDKK